MAPAMAAALMLAACHNDDMNGVDLSKPISFATDATTISGITPYMVDNGTSVTYYALVLPGTTFKEGDKFFSLTDADGTTYSYDLNIDGGFTAGQSQYCDIDLTVKRTGITITGFGIGNWDDGLTPG